jgi:hypothetical protein
MWATTFAFQPWHSAVEFKRYLHRFMLEFSRIETLAGVKRTVYNQYDSWCGRCRPGCKAGRASDHGCASPTSSTRPTTASLSSPVCIA